MLESKLITFLLCVTNVTKLYSIQALAFITTHGVKIEVL